MDDDGGLELKNKRTKRRGLRRTRKREDRDTGEVQRSAPDLFTQDEVQSPLIIRTDADEEGDDEAERPKTPEESGFITAPGQPAPSELAQEDEHDTMRRKALRKKKQPRKQRDRIETQSSDKSLDEGAPLLSPDPKTTEDNQTMTTSQLRMMKRDRALHMRRRQKRADSPIPEEEKSDSDKESKIDGEEEKDDKEEKPESRRRRCPTLADVQSCWMQFNDRMYRTCRLPRCCVRFFQRPLPMMGLGPMPRTAEEEGHVKAAINLERCSRDDDVLSIVVAAAEALTEDPRVVHPLVRIHFVDLRTGTYLARAKHQPDASFAWEKKTPIQKGRKKLQSNSDSEDEDEEKEDSEQEVEEDPRYVTILGGPATTQYEEATVFPLGGPRGQAQRKVDQKVEYLLPIQTRPFALRGSNTAPTWEEEIITNEGFRTFLRSETLILFELVDFGPTVPIKKARQGEGYYKIAWAFLRPIGVRGKINLGLRGRRVPDYSMFVKKTPSPHKMHGGLSPRGSFEFPVPSRHLDATHMRTLKLQLYRYRKLSVLSRIQARYRGLKTCSGPLSSETPQVFLQYLLRIRRKYPSTLTIHAGPIQAPVPRDVYRRPMLPTEMELHKLTFTDLAFRIFQKETEEVQIAEEEENPYMKRRRNEKEVCLLPDQLFHRITVGKFGATAVSYSPQGTLLAIGCCEDSVFPLKIYDPESGYLRHSFPGHHSMIYSITWTPDEKYLLSTSADGTAKLWHFNPTMGLGGADTEVDSQFTPKTGKSAADLQSVISAALAMQSPNLKRPRAESLYSIVQSMRGEDRLLTPDGTPLPSARRPDKGNLPPHLVVTLQHSPPSFVYCGLFQCVAIGDAEPESPQNIVFTGSFDHNIHLWDTANGAKHKGVLGTIVKHKSHVNAMVWEKKTGRMYTADGAGIILVWRKTGLGVETRHFNVVRVVQHADLLSKSITGLALHPTRRRGQLLVQAHQNCLRLFDLTTFQLVNPGYGGVNVTKSIVRCNFTPDGRYAVSGSEDGKVRVWEAQSGQIVRCTLAQLGYAKPLLDLAWHPSQHVIALASFGPTHPALVYCYERNLLTPAKMIEEVALDEMSKADIEAQERARNKRMENRKKLREKKEEKLKSKLEVAKEKGITI